MRRPDFIKHWTELEEVETHCYRGDTEPMALDAPLSAKLPQEAPAYQYPGLLEEGMTVCVESYIGAPGGVDGVKLEQPVLITKERPVSLSDSPFETDYL
jgi:hypothetical protein